MRISAIVPTWNEAEWLPTLLTGLMGCTDVVEVIVADNDSSDATGEIARRAGCVVVTGGSPAQGRNAGARIATGDVLLFADADAVVTSRHIQRIANVLSPHDVAAIHFSVVPMTTNRFVRICYGIMEYYVRVLSTLGITQGIGALIAVRRESFLAVRGFREDIAVAEDADFLRRLGARQTVVYDRSMSVLVSARRFFSEGSLVFAMKCVLWAALRAAGTSWSVLDYNWQAFSKELADHDREYLINRNGE